MRQTHGRGEVKGSRGNAQGEREKGKLTEEGKGAGYGRRNLQIVCTGIGGRGVLLASTILIETAAMHGLRAVGSDEYGMSQRGGSVISLIKVGDFASPLIGRENSDVLLAFEESEFYRTLAFLKKGGVAIANRKEKSFPPAITAIGKQRAYLFRTVDADGIAAARGMVQAANMVLLGFFASLAMEPYTFANMKGALEKRVSPRFRQTNIELFERGYEEGMGEPGGPGYVASLSGKTGVTKGPIKEKG